MTMYLRISGLCFSLAVFVFFISSYCIIAWFRSRICRDTSAGRYPPVPQEIIAPSDRQKVVAPLDVEKVIAPKSKKYGAIIPLLINYKKLPNY